MFDRNFITKLISAWRLPLREKIWIFFLFPCSGIVRASQYLFHFRILSRIYGHFYQNVTLSPLVSDAQKIRAWRIGRIVELTARYTPWESKCLVQATMARFLLGLYGIPYILHLGTRLTHTDDEPLKAHAWIKVGPWIIVGREGHQAFAIVGSWVPPAWATRSEQ